MSLNVHSYKDSLITSSCAGSMSHVPSIFGRHANRGTALHLRFGLAARTPIARPLPVYRAIIALRPVHIALPRSSLPMHLPAILPAKTIRIARFVPTHLKILLKTLPTVPWALIYHNGIMPCITNSLYILRRGGWPNSTGMPMNVPLLFHHHRQRHVLPASNNHPLILSINSARYKGTQNLLCRTCTTVLACWAFSCSRSPILRLS